MTAREEAERRYTLPLQRSGAAREAFVQGVAWAVEETDERVKALAWSLYASECRKQGIYPVKQAHQSGWSEGNWSYVARAALAALRKEQGA